MGGTWDRRARGLACAGVYAAAGQWRSWRVERAAHAHSVAEVLVVFIFVGYYDREGAFLRGAHNPGLAVPVDSRIAAGTSIGQRDAMRARRAKSRMRTHLSGNT